MTTLTGKFIQNILEKSGKTIVDEEILTEAERLIFEEMSAKRREIKNDKIENKDTNLTGQTEVISGKMEEFLLESLKKLGKSEIDKEVLAEVERMIVDERLSKRQLLKDIIKDTLT